MSQEGSYRLALGTNSSSPRVCHPHWQTVWIGFPVFREESELPLFVRRGDSENHRVNYNIDFDLFRFAS